MLKIAYVWRFVPILIISTNQLPKQWIATCLGLVVLIRKSHFEDWPTIAHELAHCRQSIKGIGFIHCCRYNWSEAYRFRCEAEAFAAEISECACADREHRISNAIRSLAYCYGFGCTHDAAYEAIQVHLRKKL